MEKIRKITFPVNTELNNFEEKLSEVINQSDNFLKEEIKAFIFSSSKRLRVIFTFLFQKILKIEDDKVLNIALAVELFHNASLLHDDIIDEDIKRREDFSFYINNGIKKAVLMGDMLLSFALNQLSYTNYDIIQIFSKKIKEVIEGELSQNENNGRILSKEQYLQKTFDKTAPLFIAPLEALFALNPSVDNNIKDALLNFVINFSYAFQIKNDIENLKNSKSDIKNGNYTLAMIYFFIENSSQKFDDITDNEIEKYIQKVNKDILNYKKKAVAALDIIENTVFKETLISLCNFCIEDEN